VPAREAALAAWNKPVWWPLVLIGATLVAVFVLTRRSMRRRERMNARGEILAT
jgi:Flp pilus assembly protein TadB